MSPRAVLHVRDLPLYGQTPKESPMPFPRVTPRRHLDPTDSDDVPAVRAYAFVNGSPSSFGYGPPLTGESAAAEVASIVIRMRDGSEQEVFVAPQDLVIAELEYNGGEREEIRDPLYASGTVRLRVGDPSHTLRVFAHVREGNADPGRAVMTMKQPTGTTGPETIAKPKKRKKRDPRLVLHAGTGPGAKAVDLLAPGAFDELDDLGRNVAAAAVTTAYDRLAAAQPVATPRAAA